MRSELIKGLIDHQGEFDITLSDPTMERLADHYELILEHNPILHLVGPCSPAEFATRHVLESLTMLKHLPPGTRFADIGSGGGLPAIPCLIARDDLSAVLIESKEKKAKFLATAIEQCGLSGRVELVARQFSELKRPDVTHVSCRALDGFSEKLPKLLKWCGSSKYLFFSGPAFRDALKANRVEFRQELMPFSEQRYLFYSG